MLKLIVGLGNPGSKYKGTRHNVGFEVLCRLVQKLQAAGPRIKFEGQLFEARRNETAVLLLAPQTFMNLSGRSVGAAVRFYRVPFENILVICDDFSIPLGRLRFRPGGSAGGQRGLNHILEELGTTEIPRLRIGIGPLPEDADPREFVLSRFLPAEMPTVDSVIEKAVSGAIDWLDHGIHFCMDKYNGLRIAQGEVSSRDIPLTTQDKRYQGD